MTFWEQLWRTLAIGCIVAVPSTVISIVLTRIARAIRFDQAAVKVSADNAAISSSQAQAAAEASRDASNDVRASLGAGKTADVRFRSLEAKVLELESRGTRGQLGTVPQGDSGGRGRDPDGRAGVRGGYA